MSKSSTSSKILIVGGGAAGYLTALYINKLYPDVSTTIVEDPNSPPIQVGESGNVLFTQALEFLGIDFLDWSQQTENLIKLGGILNNWRGDGTKWFHSRISHYQSLMTDKQTDLEYLKGLINSNIPIYKTFLHGFAFDNGLIPYSKNKLYNWPVVMYHFDSRKNANYLKSLAIHRGVNVIHAKVLDYFKSNSETIDYIVLDNKEKVFCDWVFDCSGLSKLILKKNYNVKFKDLSKYFLARSVVTWVEEDFDYKFATDIISRKYGWQWSIDTRHRQGNGYVYSNDFTSIDQVIAEIENSLNKKIKVQAAFDWNIEYADCISKKNVIAVGLSAGFLEPLEANGILMIIKTLNAVKDFWSPYSVKEDNKFINEKIKKDITEIVEFLTMHYQCDRNDTNFWREFKSSNYQTPFDLKDKLTDLNDFILTDKNYLEFDYSSYSIESWLMVLQATKNFNQIRLNNHSKENLNRISNQYSTLLKKSINLNSWIEHVSK